LGKTRFVAPDADERFSLGTRWWPGSNEAEKSLKQRFYDLVRHLTLFKGYDFSKTSPVRRWLE